jgi:LysM repeat protein
MEPERHVVKAGETLGGIARKYGVRQGDIAVANNITDPRKIQPGQELLIPAKSAQAGGKQAKSSKARAEAGDAAKAPPAEAKAPVAAPGAEQDLDAGLKPPSASDVPVVKIEDSSTAPQPKNP